MNERNRILSLLKKPAIPFVDAEQGRKWEILKIRNSSESEE